MKLGSRRSYSGEDIPNSRDPFSIFVCWFREASRLSKYEPNVITVATASKKGVPSVRAVLLKEFGKDGFCFFTNLHSRKAKELTENPYASIQIYWPETHRQIRISGKVYRVSEKKAELYFKTRPRGSQLSAMVSKQSGRLTSRKQLLKLYSEAEKKFRGKQIPRPSYWIGFCLIPTEFEFWSGKENRLHDRVCYKKSSHSWKRFCLFP